MTRGCMRAQYQLPHGPVCSMNKCTLSLSFAPLMHKMLHMLSMLHVPLAWDKVGNNRHNWFGDNLTEK